MLLVIISSLLVACDSVEQPGEVRTPPAVEIEQPTVRPLPTAVPSATASATAALTITDEPNTEITAVPTETPQPTATAVPTATPIPSNPAGSITLAPLLQNAFTKPVYLTHAFDERLFVVEEAGLIRIVQDGQLLDAPFLDIRDRVGSTQLEQGLLGLAFHPNYGENGQFFVNYSNPSGDTHIARFSVDLEDPNRANPDSERVLLTYEQPYPNHNGGQVAFGADGYLYIGVGDGGSANDPLNSGQNRETLLGSLLRINIDQSETSYVIPGANPFVNSDTFRKEIWAWGLRNPWRFSFDRLTGDLFIADVGQNLWEEVHFQPADSAGGENYGWNIMEATHCFASETCDTDGLELPIFEYGHSEGCSITGGYRYRGSQFPELYGNYFAGDYCQGTIWRLFPDPSGGWSSAKVLDSNLIISSFGEDAAGELYVLDHVSGSLYQITP